MKTRCRAYRLEAQNSRNVSVWSRQCPFAATDERPLHVSGSDKPMLPVCGKHRAMVDRGIRTVYAYQQTSETYEMPVVETIR
jgi:hypothetical protein